MPPSHVALPPDTEDELAVPLVKGVPDKLPGAVGSGYQGVSPVPRDKGQPRSASHFHDRCIAVAEHAPSGLDGFTQRAGDGVFVGTASRAPHQDFQGAVPAVGHSGDEDLGVGEDAPDAGDNGVGYLEDAQAPLEGLGRNDDFHGGDYSPTRGSVIDLPVSMTQGNQESEIDPKTLDAAYDLAVEALDSSSREATSIDTKLIGTFAVSIIVVGLLPIVPGEPGLAIWHYWPNWFLYLGVAAFAWTGFWVYQGFRAREFNSVAALSPTLLREHFWRFDEEAFKTKIYEWLEWAGEENRRHLNSKGAAFIFALPATALEIVFLLVWIFSREAFPISS